ncbi:MAG: hypothetical protein R3C11_13785 [Planctomycetaceae bacterium]
MSADDFWPSMHAAEAMTLAGYQDEVLVALKPRLETVADDQQRCGVARELVRAGELHYRQVLYSVLGSEDPFGHTHACESLYKIGEVNYGNLLRKSLANAEKPIQQLMAAAALAKCGHQEAMEVIRFKLNDTDPTIARISSDSGSPGRTAGY